MTKISTQKNTKTPYLKIILIFLIIGLISAFFVFDLGRFLNFEYLKSQQSNFKTYYQSHKLLSISLYFIIYIITTALSLPGAALLTLMGGALFGLGLGTLIVSFASSIGASLSFLAARFLLKENIQKKYSEKLKAINEGIEREGAFYLFTLRLIPAFPFFLINLLMGLTPIRLIPYFLVSQIGMLPGTLVFVNAGTQLATLTSVKGILSPGLIGSFVILGLFPLIVKKIMKILKKRKVKK